MAVTNSPPGCSRTRNGEQRGGDDLPGLRVEVTVALEKIYGEPEIVDVQTVPVLPEKTA